MSKFQFGQITANTSQISALSDKPQIPTSQLKGKFDGGANEVKTEINSQFTNFNNAVVEIITSSSTEAEIPTAKAVYDRVETLREEISAGDMAKSTYDTNSSGVVDNAEKLENNSVNDLLKTIYPVGSIYMTTNNVNPQTWISGTTWVAWGGGRVPLGCNETYSTPNAEGGSATVTLTTDNIPSHSHGFTGSRTQTEDKSSAHTHSFSGSTSEDGFHTHTWGNGGGAVCGGSSGSPAQIPLGGQYYVVTATANNSGNHTHTFSGTTGSNNITHKHYYTASGTNSSTGGGQAHSNMQPYITCYMWRRTV